MKLSITPDNQLTSEDYETLKQQLSSLTPNQKILNQLFDRITIFNLQDLYINISKPGYRMITQLLISHQTIHSFIIQNTCLREIDNDNAIFSILNTVLAKRTQLLKLLHLSHLENKNMPYTLELTEAKQESMNSTRQDFLNSLKTAPIASLILDEIGVLLSEVVAAKSESKYLKSLTLIRLLVALTPIAGYDSIMPQPEGLEFLEDLFRNTSLTEIIITHPEAEVKYPLYRVAINDYNTRLAAQRSEIDQMIYRNKLLEVLDYDIRIPASIMDLIIAYYVPSNMQTQDYYPDFIKELQSENSDLRIVKKLLRKGNVTELKFRERELQISYKGLENLLTAVTDNPQIDSFIFKGLHLFTPMFNFGIKSTNWVVNTIPWWLFTIKPRPLKLIEISGNNFVRHTGVKIHTEFRNLLDLFILPIETLRLTHHQPSGQAGTRVTGFLTDYHQEMLDLILRRIVTNLDITRFNMWIKAVIIASNQSNLKTLIMDENIIQPSDTVDELITLLEQNTSLTSISLKRVLIRESIFNFTDTGKPSPTDQARLDQFNAELAQNQHRIEAIAIRNRAARDRDKIWDNSFHFLYDFIRLPRTLCELVLKYYDDQEIPKQKPYYEMAMQVPLEYKNMLAQGQPIDKDHYSDLLIQLQSPKSDLAVMQSFFNNEVDLIDFNGKNIVISQAGINNLIHLLQNPIIHSFNFNGANLYIPGEPYGHYSILWANLTILYIVFCTVPRSLKLLDISRMNLDLNSEVGKCLIGLDKLLPILTQPIELLRLTHLEDASGFQSSLEAFLKKNSVGSLDLSQSGFLIMAIIKVIQNNLKSITLDEGLVQDTDSPKTLLAELKKNTTLQTIHLRKVRCLDAKPKWLKDFNQELRDIQPKLRSLEQRNRIIANREEILNLSFHLLTSLNFSTELCLLTLKFYGSLGVFQKAGPSLKIPLQPTIFRKWKDEKQRQIQAQRVGGTVPAMSGTLPLESRIKRGIIPG